MSSLEITKTARTSSVELSKTPNKTVVLDGGSTKDVIEVHDPGVAGPPNNLSIGTVTSGETASASITGIAPSQTLNLVIPVGGTYVHNQYSASSTWTIPHGLGYNPNITVVDSAGTIIEGSLNYPDTNTLVATFTASFAGKAYLS